MIQADDVIVRVLGALRLTEPVKRLLANAPDWVTRFNTRDLRTRPRLVVPDQLESRFAEALAMLSSNGVQVGDYLEFGVFNCGSLCCLYRALVATGNRQSHLFGFDSFEGLPPSAASDSGGHWQPGEFKSSLEFARRVLEYEGVDQSRVTLVKGYFDATLTDRRRADLRIAKASIIMIDCDLYSSTRDALKFCGPAILDQSVIFFDDWYPLADSGLGEKKAFDEWLEADPTLHARELFDFPHYGKAFLVSRR